MMCLSLWQPWATLLVSGKKRVETRSWHIAYRGPLLIHASKQWDADSRHVARQEPFQSALRELGLLEGPGKDAFGIPFLTRLKALPLGAIVGRVDVADCFRTAEVVAVDGSVLSLPRVGTNPRKRELWITGQEQAFGDYSPGRFAFLCANPVAFAEPISYRGSQGLFNVPDELLPNVA